MLGGAITVPYHSKIAQQLSIQADLVGVVNLGLQLPALASPRQNLPPFRCHSNRASLETQV
jgi:hypothetical protein